MFLFNPRPNLAEALREEERHRKERFQEMIVSAAGFTKKTLKENSVEIIGGIPFQACGGGRRRLSTRSNY